MRLRRGRRARWPAASESAGDLERDARCATLLDDERLDRQAVDAGLDRPDRLVPSDAERDQLLDLVLLDPDDLVARDGRTSGFAFFSARTRGPADGWASLRNLHKHDTDR
jgi:hypothetical protein